MLRPLPQRPVAMTIVALISAATAVTAAQASAMQNGPRWAPAATATIHPGVQVTIAGTPCTAGFVLTDGSRVYLTVPASCGAVDTGKAADGCTAATMPVGLPVTIQGAAHKGTLDYNSWTWMASVGETNADVCATNDLALVRLDARDIARTNPTVPGTTGPTGIAGSSPSMGTQVTAYGATPAMGLVTANANGNRDHQATFASSFTSAETGAAVLTGDGKALGMLSVIPQSAAQAVDVHDFGMELSYLHQKGYSGFRKVTLATAAS